MKAVIQRVYDAKLSAEGKTVSQIGRGLAVYFCAEKGDGVNLCEIFADKLAKLRIFDDGSGKMNLSVTDVGGEVLLISQFTLAADLHKGNRPSFFNAEEPSRARALYTKTADILADKGVPVKLGVFGADMTINQSNHGPVTIIWDSALQQGAK